MQRQIRALLQRKIRRMDANTARKVKEKFHWMCFSHLTYVPVHHKENPVRLIDLMDEGGSGKVVLLIKNLTKYIPN